MIAFPLVDTHLHIWDPRRIRYPWLDDIPLLNAPYLIEDYRKACGPVSVDKMVFVQAEADFQMYRDEVRWVTEVAEKDPGICGIVAWAPLEKGDAAEEEVAALAENCLVKGIRRIIQFEPDPDFCLMPNFIAGVRMLPKYNLSFDICISHSQFEQALSMVEKCPDVTFIMDHIAKPDIKHQVFSPWKKHLKQLSTFPNVWCKMSGLVTEADFENWTIDDLRPYIEHVIDCFGFSRVMYGGDWPVAYQATEYPRWVATLEKVLEGSSEQELMALFHDNGEKFYRV